MSSNEKKSLKPSEIRLFKMICGTTVISHSKKTSMGWVFTFPLAMAIAPCFDSNGKIIGTDVIFREWIDGAEELPVTVDSRSIMAIAKPSKEILDLYLKEYLSDPDDDIASLDGEDGPIFDDIYLSEAQSLESDVPDIFSDLPDGAQNNLPPSRPNNKKKPEDKKSGNKASGLSGGIPRQEQITNQDELDDYDGKWRGNPPNLP